MSLVISKIYHEGRPPNMEAQYKVGRCEL